MDLVKYLCDHLVEVATDPAGTFLDRKLLEKFDGQVTGVHPVAPTSPSSLKSIAEPDRDTLVHQLADLLPNLQQDPTPATNLIQILVRPSSYTFSRILQIRPAVDFPAGLSAPSPPINLATLCLLEKAKLRKSDSEIIAGKPEVVAALITLWLSTSDTAVSHKAHDVFLGLLTADRGEQSYPLAESTNQHAAYSQSLMWRRVFRDKDIYGLIYQICSLKKAGQDGHLSKRDKTVAQARLLDLVAKIDCDAVRTSQIAEVERLYDVTGEGLLEFAALRMVDYEDDVLMHMTLMDFFAELLKPDHSVIQPPDTSFQTSLPSFTLEFLTRSGLHSRTLSFYLESAKHSSLDITYLYSRSANYLSTYCSYYPTHFLSSPSVVGSTVLRLSEVLQGMTPGRWAQGLTPKHDLHVLASLPGPALLPGSDSASPLFILPVRPPNEDALQTLATVFRGPKNQGQTRVTLATWDESVQRSAARALYYLYLEEHPGMWQDVVKAAETVALKDAALAAISLMEAIINSSWSPLPSDNVEDPSGLPTETQLAHVCRSSQPLPPTGVLAILAPPALEVILPYLFRPAQTFSNLVGGGKGDVESAAYRVAAAKFDVLLALKFKLKEVVQETGQLGEVLTTVDKRLALGVLGGQSDVGGRIGTMEL
ncbi:MAG: hypothetical protein Q9170_008010 [Blastenia crenularia]